MSGGRRGHHAGAAATDHDDVVLLNGHVEHVIELPRCWTTAPVKVRGLHGMLDDAIRAELAADLAEAERSRVPIDP